MPNYYDVLGIPRNADASQIRQAFRKMARQHHPDVNPGDKTAEEKFKLINEAHSVLSEADSRRKYDRYGDNWTQADQLDQAAAQAGRPSTRPSTAPSTFSWSATSSEAPPSATSGGGRNIFEQLLSSWLFKSTSVQKLAVSRLNFMMPSCVRTRANQTANNV